MKIGALVPVRLASQRMPGKALMPIMGRPAILHLLDRLFASRYLRPQDVILCTTTDNSDDPLKSIAESVGARVFRGSRDDIIDRFNSAVAEFGFDAVIQADGDDPCSDTMYMDLCMDRLLAEPELGIVLTEGFHWALDQRRFEHLPFTQFGTIISHNRMTLALSIILRGRACAERLVSSR